MGIEGAAVGVEIHDPSSRRGYCLRWGRTLGMAAECVALKDCVRESSGHPWLVGESQPD